MRASAVRAVRTAAGERFEVDAAVLATGPAVPAMAAELGITIPDATPISLLVTTKPLPHDLTAVLNTPGSRCARRPAEPSRWTPTGRTQASPERRTAATGCREAVVDGAAGGGLPGTDRTPRLEADRSGIGPKPIPGDGDPVLGRVDDVAGLSLAFTHSGATLGLIAGELLAYEIVEGTTHPMLAEFNVRRFG